MAYAMDPDREKYFRILKEEGLNAALTALHHEMWDLEFECFEGPKGYQPKLNDALKKYRAFSLELWNKKLRPDFKDPTRPQPE